MVSLQFLGQSEEILSENLFEDMQKTTGNSWNGITQGKPCLAHLSSIIKYLCGEGALDVLHLNLNKALSTVSHTVLAPSSGCCSPHNKGGRKPGWVSGLSTVGRGWARTIPRPGGSHRMTLKWDPSPHGWTGLLAKGMDRSLLNSRGSRAGACPAKERAQTSLGPGRGKGEHEPAEPGPFELGTDLSGPGCQPAEGKCPPQFTSSFLCALWGSIPPTRGLSQI